MYKQAAPVILSFLFSSPVFAQQFYAGKLNIIITDSGYISTMKNRQNGHEYGVKEKPGILLQLVVRGTRLQPEHVSIKGSRVYLTYAGKKKATVLLNQKSDYLRLELIAISEGVDAVLWGPFNNRITDTIGNAVGVVRTNEFAIGIQCLNTKTSAGELINQEGAIFDLGTAATKTDFGSALQAFSVNRSRDRSIKVWNRWPDVPVKGIPEGGLVGSAIALFGCTNADVLPVIRQITGENKLPYAVWQNEWIKTSAENGKPYMITTFNEKNIDTFLDYAVRMGLAGVYHEDPFVTWGHFQLKKELFPNGRAGFKTCVEKAHARGLRLGFHTLSNFLTTNDPYITPVPDKRLAQAGSDALVVGTGADDTGITVNNNRYFKMKSDLNCVMIGDELIQYTGVSDTAPFVLHGCTRGAFGTKKSAHAAGAIISRLIDHPYLVLFPNWDLQKEIAGNIASFINETGADQLDFDGHEGSYASGMGDLSFNQFAEDVFRQVKHPIVIGSSRANHYFWRINNYLNWGEPWYGGFRESQSDVRINYQKFHSNNYMPNMLGWFLITATTTAEDVDWMLARAAGFNAGYALVIRENSLRNPEMDAIIRQINLWRTAQRDNMFNAEQKEWLKNTDNEAHLFSQNKIYSLERFQRNLFEYEVGQLQPGEPSRSSWSFDNLAKEQVPRIILSAKGEEGKLENPAIEINQSFRIELPVTLAAGERLVLGKERTATLYNSKGQRLKKIILDKPLPLLSKGNHTLVFDAGRIVHSNMKAQIIVKLSEKTETLPGND